MAILNSCCCMSVHNGTKLSAIYTLILYGILAISCIYVLSAHRQILVANYIIFMNYNGFMAIFYVRMVMAIITMITCVMLLISLNSNSFSKILSYVVVLSTATLVDVITEIVILRHILVLPGAKAALVMTEICYFGARFVSVFCVLCAYSLYQNYKQGIVPGARPGGVITGPSVYPQQTVITAHTVYPPQTVITSQTGVPPPYGAPAYMAKANPVHMHSMP